MLTAPRFRARPSCRPLLPQPLRPPRPLRLPLCSATSVQRSFDSEDELDRGTAEAFRRVADPAAVQKVAAHLDLIWRVSERKRPELCGSCGGTGEKECSWCHGTGVMTVGDTLYCSEGGCAQCPVCRGGGQCKCEHCRGTGKRARWLSPGQPSR